MTKVEFIEQLKKELRTSMNSSAVKENIDYYDNYITDEMKSGKSEEEVIEMLGDPWVIAQTIINARDMAANETVDNEEDAEYFKGNTQSRKRGNVHVFGMDTWWKKLLFALVIVAVVMVVITIVTGLFRIFAPILIPVAVVIIIVRMFGNNRS